MQIPFLTEGESRVFTSLVEIGESGVGNLLKSSGVSHSKIYDILKRLQKKGLASVVIRNGKQLFCSSDPCRLAELAEQEERKVFQQKEQINSLIEGLKLRQGTAGRRILSSYEGINGMKTVLEKILEGMQKNDEVLILGSPKKYVENVGGYLRDWQKRRIAKGAVCRIITDSDAPVWDEQFWKESRKKKLTFIKHGKSASPAHIVITKSAVATIYFSEIVFAILIEHPEIAKRYTAFFEQLW